MPKTEVAASLRADKMTFVADKCCCPEPGPDPSVRGFLWAWAGAAADNCPCKLIVQNSLSIRSEATRIRFSVCFLGPAF